MTATTFSDMPILASPRPNTSSPSFHRRRKSWARRLERCCCNTIAYFPLAFVYSLSTWAVYVEVDISLLGAHTWSGYAQAALGFALYALANTSYTIAVFTSAGSPLDRTRAGGHSRSKTVRDRGRYEGLPTHDNEERSGGSTVPPEWMTAVTAKSTGKPRFCKKCQTVKPDRTHHCSTCGHCVLKMDHHCPWLATCVGFRNYKPFLLFLCYITVFCWVCFAVAAYWVWVEITDTVPLDQSVRLVNIILLAVIGGIMGIVLGGFTGWHLYLTFTGQTTIESLEKTRYLTPLRKSMEHQFHPQRNYLGDISPSQPDDDPRDSQPLADRLREIHANALPGILRPEEGDVSLDPSRTNTPPHPHTTPHPSPSPFPPRLSSSSASASSAQTRLQSSYASLEAQRERDRYATYLDEKDSDALPNAFNLGWRRNVSHVFGPNPLLWGLPVCNTTGDGWTWDVSPQWVSARAETARRRAMERRHEPSNLSYPHPPPNWHFQPGTGFIDRARNPPPPVSLSPTPPTSSLPSSNALANQSPPPPPQPSSPQHPIDHRRRPSPTNSLPPHLFSAATTSTSTTMTTTTTATANWNDIPEDFLAPGAGLRGGGAGRGRKKGD